MKKSILLLLFLIFGAFSSYACTCDTSSRYNFCATLPHMNIMIRVVKIRGGTINGRGLPLPYMKVRVIEKYRGKLSTDTIVVLGQDGFNCNEVITNFKNNDTLILGFQGLMGKDTMDLSGCGCFYLQIKNAKVTGNINTWPNQTSMPYDTFLTFLQSAPCQTPTTIGETEQINYSLNVSPNPSASGIYNLLFNYAIKRLEFSVYNTFGQLVKSEIIINNAGENAAILDLSAQPKGLYFIKATDGNKTMTAKVLKE